MRAIITKWATGIGVKIATGEYTDSGSFRSPDFPMTYFHEGEWHTNKTSARDAVVDMFARRARNLRNQLDAIAEKRIEAMQVIAEAQLDDERGKE